MVLFYPDVGEAVDWLCRSFGFVERLRIGDHRSQLSFARVPSSSPDGPASRSGRATRSWFAWRTPTPTVNMPGSLGGILFE